MNAHNPFVAQPKATAPESQNLKESIVYNLAPLAFGLLLVSPTILIAAGVVSIVVASITPFAVALMVTLFVSALWVGFLKFNDKAATTAR